VIFGTVWVLVGLAMVFFPRRVRMLLMRERWSRSFYKGRFFVPACIILGAAVVWIGLYLFSLGSGV
jgi:hypothetical protein